MRLFGPTARPRTQYPAVHCYHCSRFCLGTNLQDLTDSCTTLNSRWETLSGLRGTLAGSSSAPVPGSRLQAARGACLGLSAGFPDSRRPSLTAGALTLQAKEYPYLERKDCWGKPLADLSTGRKISQTQALGFAETTSRRLVSLSHHSITRSQAPCKSLQSLQRTSRGVKRVAAQSSRTDHWISSTPGSHCNIAVRAVYPSWLDMW